MLFFLFFFFGKGIDEYQSKEVIEKIKNVDDGCYGEFKAKLKEKCPDLTTRRRNNLTVALMICSFEYDQRSQFLPEYINDDDFISKLTGINYQIFSHLYLTLDDVCYQIAFEDITKKNRDKVLNVFKVVSLTNQFLNTTRSKLLNTTQTIVGHLDGVYKQINDQAATMASLITLITNVTDRVNDAARNGQVFLNSATNIYFYGLCVVISIPISFIFPNVFLPVLCITGVYLFIEINLSDKYAYYITGPLYKYSYICFCILIVVLSVWERFGLMKVKLFDAFKTKKKVTIPRLYD